jgi:hypothetical protein
MGGGRLWYGCWPEVGCTGMAKLLGALCNVVRIGMVL